VLGHCPGQAGIEPVLIDVVLAEIHEPLLGNVRLDPKLFQLGTGNLYRRLVPEPIFMLFVLYVAIFDPDPVARIEIQKFSFEREIPSCPFNIE